MFHHYGGTVVVGSHMLREDTAMISMGYGVVLEECDIGAGRKGVFWLYIEVAELALADLHLGLWAL